MGGPFVQHAFVAPSGDELVVAEAFVYHPNEAKRDVMQQVEAALFSVRADTDVYKRQGQRRSMIVRQPEDAFCSFR